MQAAWLSDVGLKIEKRSAYECKKVGAAALEDAPQLLRAHEPETTHFRESDSVFVSCSIESALANL
jgi:hypothetical protein